MGSDDINFGGEKQNNSVSLVDKTLFTNLMVTGSNRIAKDKKIQLTCLLLN